MSKFYSKYKNMFIDEKVYQPIMQQGRYSQPIPIQQQNRFGIPIQNKFGSHRKNIFDYQFQSKLNKPNFYQFQPTPLNLNLDKLSKVRLSQFNTKNREKMYTEGNIDNLKNFDYKLPPLKPIKWDMYDNKIEFDYDLKNKQNNYSSKKNNYSFIQDYMSPNRPNNQNGLQNYSNIKLNQIQQKFLKTVRKNKTPHRNNEIISDNISKNYQKKSPSSNKYQQEIKYQPKKVRKNNNSVQFNKTNQFELLNRKMNDVRRVEKYHNQSNVNNYRDALQKRKQSKKNKQRKSKINQIFIQQKKLKDLYKQQINNQDYA